MKRALILAVVIGACSGVVQALWFKNVNPWVSGFITGSIITVIVSIFGVGRTSKNKQSSASNVNKQ